MSPIREQAHQEPGHGHASDDAHGDSRDHDHRRADSDSDSHSGHDAHDAHSGHSHGVSADADRRYLKAALALIAAFMLGEVVVGVLAKSLALISDAGHMLTDAASLVLALVAMGLAARPAKGALTFGFKRAEILSAQANGITLLGLGAVFSYEAVRRLISPPSVEGGIVLVTALVGIVVNVLAAWLISRANRSSLNVEGAYQHILNDAWAFIATALAGLVVLLTGFNRADAIATLVVAALMFHAGYGLVRESGRIFLEAAPAGLDPDAIGAELAAVPGRGRGPRSACLDHHLGVPGPLRARPGPQRPGLPRGAAAAGADPARAPPDRAQHPAGRPRHPGTAPTRRPGHARSGRSVREPLRRPAREFTPSCYLSSPRTVRRATGRAPVADTWAPLQSCYFLISGISTQNKIIVSAFRCTLTGR